MVSGPWLDSRHVNDSGADWPSLFADVVAGLNAHHISENAKARRQDADEVPSRSAYMRCTCNFRAVKDPHTPQQFRDSHPITHCTALTKFRKRRLPDYRVRQALPV